MKPRRLLALAAVAAMVPVLSACGNKEKVVKYADTEGVYVDVGALKYQVEISRQLNPSIPEDKTFLSGVADTALKPSQEWFAVFVRLENDTKQAQAASTSYVITDTEGHGYTPVAIGAANPFRYTAGKLGPGAVLPDPNSIPAQTSIGGEELLFKIDRTSMDNKPLILRITSPVDGADAARVNLDV